MFGNQIEDDMGTENMCGIMSGVPVVPIAMENPVEIKWRLCKYKWVQDVQKRLYTERSCSSGRA